MSETVAEPAVDKEFVLEDNQLVCLLTDKVKKISSKEENLQSVIRMLNEEYGFDLAQMERDYVITYEDVDTGKNKKQKIELAIFEEDAEHHQDNIIRVCVVQDSKVKETNAKKGLIATVENAMGALDNAEFGLWTNGVDYHFLQRETDSFGNDTFTDLSDFPGQGQTLEDLDRHDKSKPRNPSNDSLIKVFKRSHDYIYGNEGRKKDAFWQLLNLIFCKLVELQLDREKVNGAVDGKLNETDWSILEQLFDDASLTNPELARRVSRSREGVSSSLRKMYRLFDLPDSGNKRISLILCVAKISSAG